MAKFSKGDIVRVTSPLIENESLGIAKILNVTDAWPGGGYTVQIYSYFEPLEVPAIQCYSVTEKERKEYFKDLLRG